MSASGLIHKMNATQRILVLAENAAKATDSHLALMSLRKGLDALKERDFFNGATRPDTARIFLDAARNLATSHELQEREDMASIILRLAHARWRHGQAPNHHPPPRADING